MCKHYNIITKYLCVKLDLLIEIKNNTFHEVSNCEKNAYILSVRNYVTYIQLTILRSKIIIDKYFILFCFHICFTFSSKYFLKLPGHNLI
jgi:hypothetical protein